MTTAELIRRTRKRLGWTQEQLAEALDVSSNTVARWERGEMLPNATILRLALERLQQR